MFEMRKSIPIAIGTEGVEQAQRYAEFFLDNAKANSVVVIILSAIAPHFLSDLCGVDLKGFNL